MLPRIAIAFRRAASFASVHSAPFVALYCRGLALRSRFETYIEEAFYERLVPGEGELPLLEAVRLLPSAVVVSLEIPRRSLAEKGVGPRERLAPCVEAARSMLHRGNMP